jgi:hypothetical protein
MPAFELGPVSSSIVRVFGKTLARFTSLDSAVILTVPEGGEAPYLGPATVANLTVRPLNANEKAEAAELRSLRAALYGETAR